MNEPVKFVRKRQAAEELSISLSTLNRLIAQGTTPKLRLIGSRSKGFFRSEFEEFKLGRG